MHPNGNSTRATITPPNRTGIVSATRNAVNEPDTGTGSDPKATKKNHFKLDARLEPIRDVIESQPKAIQVTLSDTAITMLLATRKLREKRAGLVNLITNTDLFPRSANLLVKLDFPKELKDDEQTLENVQEWNDFIKKTKNDLKDRIVKQGERTADFYQEQRLLTFNNLLLVIAEGYTAWHGEIEGVENTPLSNHAYGAASVYCYYNTLGARNELFTYLHEDQETLLRNFKQTHLTTASGKALFSTKQLQELTMLLPDTEEEPAAPASPRRLNPIEKRKDDDSSTVIGNSERPRNPNPLQPPPQTVEDNTPVETEETPPPVPQNMETVIYKVKDVLFELVPPLFLQICHTLDASQAEKKADAKLEAALKHKKTLDMARILETDLADQQTVAPENMEALVNSLVDRRISSKEKQGKKALLQAVRKKSSGGAKATKTPPGKPNSGGKPNGVLKNNKRVVFNTQRPPAKRAKRQSSQDPDKDYQRLRKQHHGPTNPYAPRQGLHNSRPHYNPSYSSHNSGRATSFRGRGRGRGRNPGRGDYSNGNGRGRGRY
jgi:hypothetical protein